ncbi:hypothetical protein ACC708_09035 [Rhizobium ruizarguesonis]
MTSSKRVRGYALSIDHHRDTVYFLDGSPVLSPELVVSNDNQPRRLQFVEEVGRQLGTSRCRRVTGDVFCADHGTASFVQAAVMEKLARDAKEMAESTFRIFGTDICSIGGEDVLKLAATRLRDSETVNIDLVLQSENRDRQTRGQWAFTRLCRAVGISEIEDADILVGRMASLKDLPDGSLDFRAARAS